VSVTVRGIRGVIPDEEKEGSCNKSIELNDAFIGHARQRHYLIGCSKTGARFTKYLTTILRLSYHSAKVTIDLRQTSNLLDFLGLLYWRS